MSCGKVLKLFLISCLPVLLSVCKLNVDIPDYSLEFKGTKIYPTGTIISVSYRFNAEETYHRCRFMLSELTGAILDSGQTEPLKAGEWHTYQKDLTESPDGVYEFQLIVQAEKSSREYVDLSFLDKAFEFYIDEFPPDPPIPLLPNTQRYAGKQLVSIDHDEWTDPKGSPVKVYYTIDLSGTLDPIINGEPYNGDPIEIDDNAETKYLNLVAMDSLHNSEIFSQPYHFMKITEVDPPSAVKGQVVIAITGFGFDNVSNTKNTDVNLFDADGTMAEVRFDANVTPTQIEFFVDMDSTKYGTIDPNPDKSGTIEVKSNDPGPISVTYPFYIE